MEHTLESGVQFPPQPLPHNQQLTTTDAQGLHKEGSKCVLRDYQIPAEKALRDTVRGILKSPAGSGKTIIGAAALDGWAWMNMIPAGRKMRIAWVAMSLEQIDQGKAAVALIPRIARSCQVDFFCYAGCPSLAGYDLAILDECHHIAAPEYCKVLAFHEGCRWGLSATPERADDLAADVFKLIGPIVHTVPRDILVAAGQIAEARVIIECPNRKGEIEKEVAGIAQPEFDKRKKRWPYLFKNPRSSQEQMSRIIWQACLDVGIQGNPARNDRVVARAKQHAGDSTLILVGKIEHGDELAARIPGSMMVFSKMGAKRRRAAIQSFAAGELKCMLATSLADEGLDVPRASILIQVSGGRSAAKAEQRTGRVLRAFHDAVHGTSKTHGTIYDFDDQQHYFLAAQSRRRIAVYTSLGYKVTNL